MPSDYGSSPAAAGPSPASPCLINYMSDDEIATSDVTLSGGSEAGLKRRRIGRFSPPKSILLYREPPSSPTIDRRRGKRATQVPSATLAAARRKAATKQASTKQASNKRVPGKQTSHKETSKEKSPPEKACDETTQPWEYDIFDAMNGPSTPPRAGFDIYHDIRSPTLSQKSSGTPSNIGLSSEQSER